MPDLKAPLNWDKNADDKGSGTQPFAWPNPPYPSYPEAFPQSQPLECEIVGRNSGRINGRLILLVPEDSVAHVQVPPARTTIPLRFDQFESILLKQPLSPDLSMKNDPSSTK